MQAGRGGLGQDRDAEPPRRQLRQHAWCHEASKAIRARTPARVEERPDARPAGEADQRLLRASSSSASELRAASG